MNFKAHRKINKYMERIGLSLVRTTNHYIYTGFVNNNKITITSPATPKNNDKRIHFLNQDIKREFRRVGAVLPPKLGK